MFVGIRDWFFPKVPMLPLEFDEDGWQICFNGARKHKVLHSSPARFTFRCLYKPKDPVTGAGKLSMAYPPLHWHRDQIEYFDVHQGRVGYMLDGQEGYASAGEQVIIPKGAVHTFWCDATADDDLIMDISTEPGEGMDEQWINATYGIMESHFRAGKPPSFLQMMVMWDAARTAPGGYSSITGILLAWLFGRIIGKLAGYRATYPIFALPPKAL